MKTLSKSLIILLLFIVYSPCQATNPIAEVTDAHRLVSQESNSTKGAIAKLWKRFKVKIKTVRNWMWGCLIGSLVCTGLLSLIGNNAGTAASGAITSILALGALSILLFLTFAILIIVLLVLLYQKDNE